MGKKITKTGEKIIFAAMECYREYGVQGSSMDIIAEKAETTKPTLYSHFGSKDKLFDEVFDYIRINKFSNFKLKYVCETCIIDQLVNHFLRIMDQSVSREMLELYRSLMIETIRRGEEVKMEGDSTTENQLQKWIEDAVKAGVLNVEDTETTAYNLLAMFRGRFIWPTLLGIKRFPKNTRKGLLEKSIKSFITPLLVK
ncbi:MAG: TetR/AcrR family transcriptional regulator [Alphaproteobacteria bacterium]|nr:TetR/AcrR family transcriptional regulator [Alphaproteobacteria bacterium]